MHAVHVIGARPNFVKMAPVIAELRRRDPDGRHVVVHTGQHYDRAMSDLFLDELGIGEPDHLLGIGSGTHAVQTARVMERLEPILAAQRPDLVLVPGDVNSTLAAALVACKLQIPVAHLEAGLRSYDRTMPEEINRVLTDQVSELLFIHSEDAAGNLAREGVAAEKIHFVGNTMIDTLVALEPRFRSLAAAAALGLEPGTFVLVTLHRPSLVDGPLLFAAMRELDALAATLPVVFPVHPRTRSMLGDVQQQTRVRLVEPLGYLEFLSLMADSRAVLTDSGGIQEETTYLGIPCFTLRSTTERPITVTRGTNVLLGLEPERIRAIPDELKTPAARLAPPAGWDGRAARRVADVLTGMTHSAGLAGVPR